MTATASALGATLILQGALRPVDTDMAQRLLARIAVRPTRVGLLDFDGRLPSPLGGVQQVAS